MNNRISTQKMRIVGSTAATVVQSSTTATTTTRTTTTMPTGTAAHLRLGVGVDEYAQRVLEQTAALAQQQQQQQRRSGAPPGTSMTVIDPSLGPYVASCLRNGSPTAPPPVVPSSFTSSFTPSFPTPCTISTTTTTNVRDHPDFESLCELLAEHLQLNNENENNHRADGVVTAVLQRIADAVLHNVFADVDRIDVDVDVIDAGNTTSRHQSPTREDGDDDWGAASNNSGVEEQLALESSLRLSSSSPLKLSANRNSDDAFVENGPDEDTPNPVASCPSTATLLLSNDTLDAQTVNSTQQQQLLLKQQQQQLLMEQQQHKNDYERWYQEQVAHYLQSINTDLSDAAALAAVLWGEGHWNVAQYAIEAAAAQLPLCRNLTTQGRCYRSDCSFSHDATNEHHTCHYWMRSRCSSNAASCLFLHGFSEHHRANAPEPDTAFYDQLHPQSSVPSSASWQASQAELRYDLSGTSGGDGGNNGYYSHFNSIASASSQPSLWKPSPPPSSVSATSAAVSTPITARGDDQSFANIATQGYDTRQSFHDSTADSKSTTALDKRTIPTVPIPQDLWKPHEQRNASAFYIADPLERYQAVMSNDGVNKKNINNNNVIDLHFQSLQTFAVVLDAILPTKLQRGNDRVWIVTGTGHHVGTKTHQKGGGALEAAVLDYVLTQFPCYTVSRGRDRNGKGGALLVQHKTE